MGLPDAPARREILEVVLAGEALAPEVDLASIAAKTPGFSGADLKQLCVAAAMRPVRDLLEATSKAPRGTSAAGGVASGARSSAGASPGRAQETQDKAERNGENALLPPSTSLQSVEEADKAGDDAQAGSLGIAPEGQLGQLLQQAEVLAGGAVGGRAALRPISAADFEAALLEVGPTVDPDAGSVQELNEWNAKYGSSAGRGTGAGKRLSYYT